ncbi:MAG: hypothetical protein JOZ57_01855, partial [Abitibacteriaceae bacterium]|nr:hypothetical protein [Abditibacteriaceae bacterium]
MHKCIVTGLGGRGLHWLNQTKQREDVEIVVCVEPMEANRQRAVERHNIPQEKIFNS